MAMIRLLALTLACASSMWSSSVLAAPASADHSDAGHVSHASHGEHGADPFALDPISIDPDLAIFTLALFLGLWLVTSKFAWEPIAAGLAKRDAAIAEGLAAAQRSQEEANRLVAEYEQRMAVAAEQVRGIVEEARRDAEHIKADVIAEAKAEALIERNRSLEQIATATDVAVRELAQSSTTAALELASKFVPAKLGEAERAHLVQEAMAQVQAGFGSTQSTLTH